MDVVDVVLTVRLGDDADERDVREAATQVRHLLLQHRVEGVRFAPIDGEAAQGSKSGALLAIGTLVVTLGPQAFSTVLAALQTWAARDTARSVDIRIGEDSFTGSGLTRAQQDALVAGFLERLRAARTPGDGDGDGDA